MKFPEIRTKSPSGWDVVLPDAAKGRVALVVVTLTSLDRRTVEAWLTPFELEFGDSPLFTSYELMIISDLWTKSASGQPVMDSEYRLAYYGKPERYVQMLGLDIPGIPYAYILDRAGFIRWRGGGEAKPGEIALMLGMARLISVKKAA